MNDLWCMFGRLAAEPSELSTLSKGFTLFAHHSYVEQKAGQTAVTKVITTTGLLSETATEAMQAAIQLKLDTQFPGGAAPIVSLFAAARICRLMTVDAALIASALGKFKAIYAATFGTGLPTNVHIQTAMGAAMVDKEVRARFIDALREEAERKLFRLDPPPAEYSKFLSFLAHNDYSAAQNEFCGAPSWDITCADKMHWYDKAERMAN